jgi:sulfoxide reductase heme-binding subunit YedZ
VGGIHGDARTTSISRLVLANIRAAAGGGRDRRALVEVTRMGHGYRAIQWTPYKLRYDAAMLLCVIAYLVIFIFVGKKTWAGEHAISDEILVMRALGTCAIVLLHVVLSIGPLARLNRRFLPLLYNRRHLGVMTFLLALGHAGLAIGFYHGFGVLAPQRSVLVSNVQYRSLSAFPFEILGLIGLVILFLMAATSHDFWLKNLTPRVWKWLHMLVYVAWAALIFHVLLGAMQAERSGLYPILLIAGVVWIASLHLVASWLEQHHDAANNEIRRTYWVDVGWVEDWADGQGKAVPLPGGERIAIFRYGDKFSALDNVCAHQGGPLGEGRVIDGCVTCPWHGFTYRPHDGCAPPPFTEKVATYPVRVFGRRILVHPVAMEPGTPVEPARIGADSDEEEAANV